MQKPHNTILPLYSIKEAWKKEGMGWDAPIESISRLPQNKK